MKINEEEKSEDLLQLLGEQERELPESLYRRRKIMNVVFARELVLSSPFLEP